MMMMRPIWVFVSLVLAAASNYAVSATSGVFHVQHKFAGQEISLYALKDHDLRRHQRVLYSVDFPLGGDGRIHGTGLYYAKLKIGSPTKDYYLQVDTGSDISLVNCIECSGCPEKSDLGVELTLYDPSTSSTSRNIDCDHDFCTSFNNGTVDGCVSGQHCEYQWQTTDGAGLSDGYFVRDIIQYGRVSGDLRTTPSTSSVVFGCTSKVTGKLEETDSAVDGILGFGHSDRSILSQIAASGSMEKKFAHCVDGKNGGGIFAMGNIVQTNVTTTPYLPDQEHLYVINLEGILIGENSLALSKDVLDTGNRKGAMIDSGSTLAYFPEEIYTPLVKQIMDNHGDLIMTTVADTFQCFEYKSSLDTNFPIVTLIFEGGAQLVVYPHDYLIPYDGESLSSFSVSYCIGWQNSESLSADYVGIITLGDLVFANKLVVYDIEKMNIGWKEYNCSSTIKVQDEKSKAIYDVQAHRLSFTPKSSSTPVDRSSPSTDDSSTPNHSLAHHQYMGRITILLLFCPIIVLLCTIFTEF